MEEPERVPVFHTRLARTQRRRLLKPDGSSAGWLIINAADTIASARGTDDPPQLAIPSQR